MTAFQIRQDGVYNHPYRWITDTLLNFMIQVKDVGAPQEGLYVVR